MSAGQAELPKKLLGQKGCDEFKHRYDMGTITRLQAITADSLNIGITGALDWNTPTESLTSNNLYATVSFDNSEEVYGISQYLHVSNFGFTLPDTAVIEGIVASIERKGVGEAEDYYVGLVYPASGLEVTTPGKQKVAFWPTSDATSNYGSSSDTWNKIWLPSEINDINFGLGLSAEGRPSQADAALVDFVDITIYWHQEIFPTISGGFSCSGSADVFMPNASAFGRARVSGQALVSRISIELLDSSGVLLEGEATAHDFIQPVGGIGVGGLPSIELTYNPKTSGGTSVEGTATIIFADFVDGGIKISGVSVESSSYQPQGGILGGGTTATASWTYNHTPSNGILVINASVIDPIYMDGGSLSGGQSNVGKTGSYLPEGGLQASGNATLGVSTSIGENGIQIGGSSTAGTTFPLTIGGGIRGNGNAFIDPYIATGGAIIPLSLGESAVIMPYWDQAEGGVNASGSAAVARIQFPAELDEYHWTMFINSEEPSAPQSHDKTGWGSFWLNPDTNKFGWYISFDFDTVAQIIRIRGPADFGSDSTAQIQIGGISGYSSPNIGSTTITESQKTDLLNGLWYIWILSYDGEQLRGQITKYQTGIKTSGTAIYIHQEFGEGGTSANGTADIDVKYTPSITFVGAKTNGAGQIAIATSVGGGITLVGLSVPTTWHYLLAVGGSTAGGDVFELLNYRILTSGGIEVNGAGTIGIGPAIGGGGEISGSHIRSYIAGPSMIGGASVSPLHTQTFIDFYISVAAMRVGGKARREKIKFFTPIVHIGYGRAMGSENIFTAVIYEQELIPPTGDVSPELEEDRFRTEHTGIWCDVGSACGGIKNDGAALPEIVQRRQVGHLPPKTGSDTSRDRGITTIDAV